MSHFSTFTALGALILALCFTACSDDDTYADLRDRENKQISSFLQKGCTVRSADDSYDYIKVDPIKVISEAEFYANDSTTDVSKNEYVLFEGSGVYMQIVRKGTGRPLASGESALVLCRFTEFNIAADTVSLTNIGWQYEQWPERMTVRNSYGTYSSSFLSGVMYKAYNSSSVPSGWLLPLPFLKLGRQTSSSAEIAKVRLIVPSTEGQTYAYRNVVPYFYEITYQRAR